MQSYNKRCHFVKLIHENCFRLNVYVINFISTNHYNFCSAKLVLLLTMVVVVVNMNFHMFISTGKVMQGASYIVIYIKITKTQLNHNLDPCI